MKSKVNRYSVIKIITIPKQLYQFTLFSKRFCINVINQRKLVFIYTSTILSEYIIQSFVTMWANINQSLIFISQQPYHPFYIAIILSLWKQFCLYHIYDTGIVGFDAPVL